MPLCHCEVVPLTPFFGVISTSTVVTCACANDAAKIVMSASHVRLNEREKIDEIMILFTASSEQKGTPEQE